MFGFTPLLKNTVIGEIKAWSTPTAPAGWLLCDGQTLNISSYPKLYSVIGTIYGGNGTTNFKLPDFRGRVPIGVGQQPAITAVAEVTNLTVTTGCSTTGIIIVALNGASHPVSVIGNTTAVAEVTNITVSTACTANGSVIITFNGTGYNVDVLNGDTTAQVASKIQTAIDALADYNATVNSNVVTITAVNARSESDASFNSNGTGVGASIQVITQGVNGIIGDTTAQVASKIQAAIDAIADYSATVNDTVVTITAVNARSESDAIFNSNGTGVGASIQVITQGISEVIHDVYALGGTGGIEKTTLVVENLPPHDHIISANATTAAASTATPDSNSCLGAANAAGRAANIYSTNAPNITTKNSIISQTGGGQSFSNTQPFIVLNYIIAYEGILP